MKVKQQDTEAYLPTQQQHDDTERHLILWQNNASTRSWRKETTAWCNPEENMNRIPQLTTGWSERQPNIRKRKQYTDTQWQEDRVTLHTTVMPTPAGWASTVPRTILKQQAPMQQKVFTPDVSSSSISRDFSCHDRVGGAVISHTSCWWDETCNSRGVLHQDEMRGKGGANNTVRYAGCEITVR